MLTVRDQLQMSGNKSDSFDSTLNMTLLGTVTCGSSDNRCRGSYLLLQHIRVTNVCKNTDRS